MPLRICLVVLISLLSMAAGAADKTTSESTELNRVVDRIAAQESKNLEKLRQLSPIAETYVQQYKPDKDFGRIPIADHYFLARVSFGKPGVKEQDLLSTSQQPLPSKILRQFLDIGVRNRTAWIPTGFAQMAILGSDFDRTHYDFTFDHREFLGALRCLVFNVVPKAHSGGGKFLGQIWVEDRDYNIVRANGSFIKPRDHGIYIHFDSWRANAAPGVWVPACIYGEESKIRLEGKLGALRSETYFWFYGPSQHSQNELTAILVDSRDGIRDQSTPGALSPIQTQRLWLLQAENNILARMEQAGILAPASEVDTVLQTVANNLIASNDLTIDPEVRCRVLLTTPIEAFTVGHTIVLSRGLLDVLPDEAALAAVLAQQLSHIILAHDIDSSMAFSDRILFPDDQIFSRLLLKHDPQDQQAAAQKARSLLDNSPYKEKLASAAVFFRQLELSRQALPNLVEPRLGDPLIPNSQPNPTGTETNLDPKSTQQVAALPLGTRIELAPWTSRLTLNKASSVEALTLREKMPLQITPVRPYERYLDNQPAAVSSLGNP